MIQAVIHAREDIVVFILGLQYEVDLNAQDVVNIYLPHPTEVLGDIYMSRRMGKSTICIGENKGADQLRSNCEADQRLCFRYAVSTIPLLSKSKISSL